MAASSSTAASTSTSSFDVFINHRGCDVKKNFASHLYQRLRSYGLNVFLDQEELQRGDCFSSQIRGAIRAASVHVAIFSVGYAESTWCLNELLWMSESEAPIIPVFYHVEPAELRWMTLGKDGVYAQALHKLEEKTTDDPQTQTQGEMSPHEATSIINWRNALSIQHWRNALKKYDPQAHQKTLRHNPATVAQWRKALHNVSLISGFELKECNGDDGILLTKVIESVLKNVKKPLDVAKYPTGLAEKITDFENTVLLPHLQSGRKPQIVGIVGLGGAGKTTLAKELFNRESSQYNRRCFLADVRENVNKGSLISLQSQLLNILSGRDLQIHNKDEAIRMLKNHLPSHQILLILDDVDGVDQVDALVPNQTSIHPNSLILITSRDKDVLTRSGVENSSIYKLNGLNEQHSLELFCWHAFRRSDPLAEFENLTAKFVNACNGLPLSLKVFGALLYGNTDISYWQQQLDKLVKILPTEIQERLRISYEALDSEEKQMFLDIACFFLGEDRDMAITIWNGSGWEGELGFQTLQNKCLVEVVEQNSGWNREIRMHDHLRDLGRAQARVSQPLRFWHIDDLLQQSSVITVRGIRMVLSEYLDTEEFDNIQMKRLQLVDTEGILMERIMRTVKSPDLIWLCWRECPYSSLPDWIPMKKLRVLRVSGGTLETLWQQESQWPLCLVELRLDGCRQLKSIQGFAQLTKLRLLDVSRCTELEELSGMETLVSLEGLRAGGCRQLKSIRGLEHATKLNRLSVYNCTELEELPNMKTLVCLERLWAWGCVKLKSIRGLEHATKLEVLSAWGCVKLKSIRGLEHATKLNRLDVHDCTELEELPNMKTVVCLEAWGCVKLKSIRGLEHATKLNRLVVDECTELEELPNMKALVCLEQLWALGCVKLKSIRGLEHATKLRTLGVSWCTELEELPNMKTLVCLEVLWASGCVKLKSIRGLEHATKLRRLVVDHCTELEELPNRPLVCLEELSARGCVKLKSIRGLEHATKLNSLDVGGCTELEELPNMESLVCLKELLAWGCVNLKSIRGLEHATEMGKLNVRCCLKLEEVEGVEHCTWLKELDVSELDVSGCPKLQCLVWE